jgi:D-beta-D-heptose 7-phosphate kinase / D-beta-D-heptose 1-phosphate adenosyltransferase
MKHRASEIVRIFSTLRAAVVGEAMLDRYSIGHGKRLSVEAPVPIVDNCSTLNFAGAAANVALNLRMLGADVSFVSVIGQDVEGAAIQELHAKHGICLDYLQSSRARSTLSKHRILASNHMVARFDHGSTTDIDYDSERTLIHHLTELINRVDVVVVSDYAYGIITPGLVAHLAKLTRKRDICLTADSKRLQQLACLSPTAVKPNYREALQLLNLTEEAPDRVAQLKPYAQEMLRRTGSQMVALTLDDDGALIFQRGQKAHRTTAQPMPHSQAAGAGDTYLAALSLALAASADVAVAGNIAAAAASVVVGKNHTAACCAEELLASLGEKGDRNDQAGLTQQMERYRNAGRRIVLTSGCFDILHRGHVTYLERARSVGDVLVVGVNSDESIRRLKGAGRPINSLDDRLGVLAGLSCVNHLTSFNDLTPDRLIEAVRPHVFVKGGDYTRQSLPEASLVEAMGGRVVILPYICNHSTTRIVERIRRAAATTVLPANGKNGHENSNVGRRTQPVVR